MGLNANQLSVKVLPVDLPVQPWPIAIVTLKNRTLTAVAQLFIDYLRHFTRSMAKGLRPQQQLA